MPPALSDYDSDFAFDFDTHARSAALADVEEAKDLLSPKACQEYRVTTQKLSARAKSDRSVVTSASKKRKRSSVLAGLDLDNITADPNEHSVPPATNCAPKSSATTFTFRTRAQANGKVKSELCYDQKYHPMDDYLQPLQAAQCRAKYEDLMDVSDATKSESELSEAKIEVREQPRNGQKKRKQKSIQKRRQGHRQSSQNVGHDVLYNMKIHPQDSATKQLEDEQDLQPRSNKMESVERQDEEGHGNDPESHVSSLPRTRFPTDRDHPILEVHDTEDETHSKEFLSSLLKSSPLSSIDVHTRAVNDDFPSTVSDLNSKKRESTRPVRGRHSVGAPFTVYEETLPVQLASDASAPEPVDYPFNEEKQNASPTASAVETGAQALPGITLQPLGRRDPKTSGDADNQNINAAFESLYSDLIEADALTSDLPLNTLTDGAHNELEAAPRLGQPLSDDGCDSNVGHPSSQQSPFDSILGKSTPPGDTVAFRTHQ